MKALDDLAVLGAGALLDEAFLGAIVRRFLLEVRGGKA